MSRHIYIHKNGGAAPPIVPPTVEIVSITNITSNGATVLARVLNDGGSTIDYCNFYFFAPMQQAVSVNVSPNPDGTFSSTVSTLVANTQYYLTASATNSAGTGSASQYFTTGTSITVPICRINSIGNISGNSAEVACEILSKGGGTISVSGICWNTTGSPTTANSKTTNGITEVGTFTSVMTGLQPGTTYYVSAYATNEAGTAYSSVSSFLTTAKVLILQFDTNCPATKSFNPSIVSISGSYEWELGDGTTVTGNAVGHTYANSNTKTVKLYCTSGPPSISDILMFNQYVVGMMDISNQAFASLVRVNIYSNPLMTGITLPSVITGAVEIFNISENAITAELDLSALVNFNSGARIAVNNNPITFVYFGNTATGKMKDLEMRSCNLTGMQSVSWLSEWADNSSIMLLNNPLLTDFNFGTTIASGSLQSLDVRNCALNNVLIQNWTTATRAAGLVYIFQDNAMTAAEVNRMLFYLNIWALNGSSGQIFIAGNNAPPDATSDNLNGLAFKASLISKGFYVSTN